MDEIKVTLVIPTLNEIQGLKLVMPRIDKSIFEEIIVIDAQSTDGTVEYIKKFNDIQLVTQLSKGLTAAMVEAIDIVKTEYIIEFSPDNNCTPEELPLIVDKLKEPGEKTSFQAHSSSPLRRPVKRVSFPCLMSLSQHGDSKQSIEEKFVAKFTFSSL